jgi:hypothetical protein
MKKWHFTLKNGAFYPRIQSILAFFLMIFYDVFGRENLCVSGVNEIMIYEK